MRIKKHGFIAVCAVGVILMTLFSCSNTVKQTSFTAALDEVDSLIYIGKADAAIKSLKNLEKTAISASNFLSIVKRYIMLGEITYTERTLQSALKKNPGNQELSAVYTFLLLKQDKYEQAHKIATTLTGTSYGSLYAEVLLKEYQQDESLLSLYEADFANAFADAWEITKNEELRQNAAVLTAVGSSATQAYYLHPKAIDDADQTFFWAFIAYDSGNFVQAHEDALAVSNNTEYAAEIQGEALLLAADAALKMGSLAKAQESWQTLMYYYPDYSPIPYFNSFVLFTETDVAVNEYERQVNRLYAVTGLIKNFPMDLYGLTSYGQFALETDRVQAESDIQKAVRVQGFRTLAMEYADSMPRIPVSDALYRFEQALESKKNDLLYLEYLKLQWKHSNTKPADARIWALLEQYPASSAAAEYAVWHFVQKEHFDEATALLQQWEGKPDGEWTLEYIALLKALSGDSAGTEKILESFANNSRSAQRAVSNLAYFKEAAKQYNEALELYSIAAGRTLNKNDKAELHYRIARIYTAQRDIQRAKMSLMYTLTLNPEHNRARLLLKKLPQ